VPLFTSGGPGLVIVVLVLRIWFCLDVYVTVIVQDDNKVNKIRVSQLRQQARSYVQARGSSCLLVPRRLHEIWSVYFQENH